VIIGREEHRYKETASTNDLAFDLAARGCREGTVVVARSQTGGRGRHGRRWFSVPGGSLTFSVLLEPVRDRGEWHELPWVVAGAVAEALVGLGIGEITLKSPNDVLAGRRKIAGVLLENRIPGSGPFVVAGIGVNVNIGDGEFPKDLGEIATSVRERLGEEKDPEDVLAAIYLPLDRCYGLWQEGGAAPVWESLKDKDIEFIGFSAVSAT
jgi:BirA family biotin operon repressor/biotin-[acetyl-CoA-carboxylase] ligase